MNWEVQEVTENPRYKYFIRISRNHIYFSNSIPVKEYIQVFVNGKRLAFKFYDMELENSLKLHRKNGMYVLYRSYFLSEYSLPHDVRLEVVPIEDGMFEILY